MTLAATHRDTLLAGDCAKTISITRELNDSKLVHSGDDQDCGRTFLAVQVLEVALRMLPAFFNQEAGCLTNELIICPQRKEQPAIERAQ